MIFKLAIRKKGKLIYLVGERKVKKKNNKKTRPT